MDPDPQLLLSADRQVDPNSGVAPPLGAPPEPSLPAPPADALDAPPRRRRRWAVLRVLLATLALGWWTQRAMRRHFDAGPYTGPLYLYYPDGTTQTPGLMDDTGRIVVPAGEYQDLQPIAGWRSAWIGQRMRPQVVWSTSAPFLRRAAVKGPPEIVQAGVDGRPLNPAEPKPPYLQRFNQRSIVLSTQGGPRAYRPDRYPELLEVYSEALPGIIDGQLPPVRYILNIVRRTDGETLLAGSRLFRLSLDPPTYLVTDAAGVFSIQRWDGTAFQASPAFSDFQPKTVAVLQASPLTLAITEDPGFINFPPSLYPVGVRVFRLADGACETLGRYRGLETIHGNPLATTDLQSEILGQALPYSQNEFLAATTDKYEEWVMDRSGRELFPKNPKRMCGVSDDFVVDYEGVTRDAPRYVLARATGQVYECRSSGISDDGRHVILRRLDGSWLLLDAAGQAIGDPAWTHIESVADATGQAFLVELNGRRGIWEPARGYTVPLEYVLYDRIGRGIFRAIRDPALDPPPQPAPPAATTPATAPAPPPRKRSQIGFVDRHGTWLVPPTDLNLTPIGDPSNEVVAYSNTDDGFVLHTTTGEQRHIKTPWRNVGIQRIGAHLLNVYHRTPPNGPDHFALLDEQGTVLIADQQKGFSRISQAHDIVSHENAKGHIGLYDAQGKTFLEHRYTSPCHMLTPDIAYLTEAPAFRANPGATSIVLCDLRTGARTPPGVVNVMPIVGAPGGSLDWLEPGAATADTLLAQVIDPAQPQGPPIRCRLDAHLQPYPGDLALQISGLGSISSNVNAHGRGYSVEVEPGTGSWRSARVGLANRDGKLWNLVDADLQPILSQWLPNPTIVDPRFLSFRPLTGTILVDRFGHTVTPHE